MKNYRKIIFYGLIQLPLLISFLFIDYLNLFGISVANIIILLYLLVSLVIIGLGKYGNKKFKLEIKDFAYSNLLVLVFLIPGLLVAKYYISNDTDFSNLILRTTGKLAFFYLALTLCVTPIGKIFPKLEQVKLLKARKYLGVLAFVFFLKHGIDYYLLEYNFFKIGQDPFIQFFAYVFKNLKLRIDAIIGMIAGTIMLVLGLTSNKFSYVKLGKLWQSLHYMVYPLFVLAMVHIAFAGRFSLFYGLLFVVVVGLRFYVFLKSLDQKPINTEKTTKYICLVCGYIYDEALGDPDGGLAPGTKFEDIPDGRTCPVCGVSKEDFEPYYVAGEGVGVGNEAEMVSMDYLTEDVIELVLKLDKELEIKLGQFFNFELEDSEGKFMRSYSVAKYKDNKITFLIKLEEKGRAGQKFPTMKVGDKISLLGPTGKFVLRDNTAPKVFIATGTGLSPIYGILNDIKDKSNCKLYFGVKREKDLFYMDKLKAMDSLDLNIYLSQEETKKYNSGRINVKDMEFDSDTEFYICGNPALVDDVTKILKEKGFENIYFEKFL